MKFKMLLAGLAAVSMAAAAPSQTSAPDFTPEAFRAHVGFLADDLLEGREAGTRGYDLAARYVAAQFEALGLRPGAGGGWFQPIEFARISTAGTPRLTVGGHALTNGEEIVFRPSASGEALSLEAPLLFAGYGLDMPARGFDDYRGLDARGKIVVVLDGYPEGTPSDVGAHLNSEKARMAADRGAVGLITVRTRSDPEGAGWRRFRMAATRPLTTWVAPDGRAFAPHGLAFTATVDRAAAEPLFAEAGHPLDQLIAQAPRPRGFAFAAPARVEREAATSDRFTSANVVAVLPGTDPELADEYVLLMAHLDGLGIRPEGAGNAGEDRIRNGAMDNATGIATLIEVAREMSEPGNRPRRPVVFAAVTAEEKGLLGAEFLAAHPVTDGRIAAVVNLDMPVLTYDFQDVIAFGAEHSTLGPIVERAASRMGVALTPDPLPQEGLFTRSDHYEFVRVGVPAVFLMTGFAGEGQQRFTHFLQNEYHSPRDDMALPFDWNAGARFARLNYLIASEIANGEQAPLWYADSFFGDAFARGQRRAQRPAAPHAASR
jgi:Zn-dependent M28 family amino/carboxypeptidase